MFSCTSSSYTYTVECSVIIGTVETSFWYDWLYWLPRAARTNYCKLGDLKRTGIYSLTFLELGGWDPGVGGVVSSLCSEWGSVPGCRSGPWGGDNPWCLLLAQHNSNLHLPVTPLLLLCLSLFSSSYKDTSHTGLGLILNQYDLIFKSLVTSAKTLFSNKVTYRGMGVGWYPIFK